MSSWYQLDTTEVLQQLDIDAEKGLSQTEVAFRLTKYGPNELQETHPISPWALLLEQFKNVLVVILIIVTVISFFLGHSIEAIAISVIVLFAVLLGFVQEYRAEKAIRALREMTAPTATTLRDGDEVKIAARDLVPGDIILLRPGDRVPADARLIKAFNLQVEESALTGESVPIEKHIKPLTGNQLSVGDRKNMVHAGTAITYGRAKAVVVATGMNTEFGRIAQLLQTVETSRTPLQENLDRVGHVLVRATLIGVAIIVVLGLLRGQPLIEMFIFGVALAVAVVPEALPAVVTISLAIGVQQMVKRRQGAIRSLLRETVLLPTTTGKRVL
jgi:Ca2+-transporting ATPase